MNALDQYLLRAYLDGELSPAEAEAFEQLVLQRPDLAEMLDADSALRFGLGEANAVRSAPQSPVVASVVPIATHRKIPPFVPLAAAAAVALGIGIYTGRLGTPRAPAFEEVSVAYVDKVRGISAVPEIALPASGAMVLMVPVASAQPCRAGISITQAEQQALVTEATSDAFGYASVLVPRDRLRLGAATVTVACGTAAAGTYSVQLVSPQ